MNTRDIPDRLSSYLEYLAAVTRAEPAIHHFMPVDQESGRVLAATYANFPNPGYVTGFTYGLSLVDKPDWAAARRELCITVRSDDMEWTKIPSRMVASMRGICSFNRGQALGYAGVFVEESRMSSVLLAEPVVSLGGELVDLTSIKPYSREPDLVEIIGVYPIYASERDLVYSSGFDALWNLPWDRVDPMRLPAA